MVFVTTLFCQFLFAASALALPSGRQRLAARLERRAELSNRSPRPQLPPPPPPPPPPLPATLWNKNWAGAIITTAVSGNVEGVSAQFTVPTPHIPSSDFPWDHSAAIWVGIDGFTCTSAILQVGVDVTVSISGSPPSYHYSYKAWSQWYPDPPQDFDMEITAGDVISLYVATSSSTSGKAEVRKVGNNELEYQEFDSSHPLCQSNAEWIVEDYLDDSGMLVPLANFTTVTFSNAQAMTRTMGTIGPDRGQLVGIESDSVQYTSASTTPSSVTVTYV